MDLYTHNAVCQVAEIVWYLPLLSEIKIKITIFMFTSGNSVNSVPVIGALKWNRRFELIFYPSLLNSISHKGSGINFV